MYLLTNDDGIDAPGLAALERAVRGLGPAAVVAPAGACSGCSHQATTDVAIAVERRGPGRRAVGGTPVDCVRVALHHEPDDCRWVLSGVNAGGNLGVDIHHSGTVAAVREAALYGLPGIAFSQYRRDRREVDWSRAERWTRRVLQTLLAATPPAGSFWNVNFPDPNEADAEPALVHCEPDSSAFSIHYRADGDGRVQYQSRYQDRPRRTGADVDVCFRGAIAVSLIRADWARCGHEVDGAPPPGADATER